MAVPTPVPEAAAPVAEVGPAMGSLFDTYDPTGALNGLFVPAYIKGFAPSEQAVAQWQAENHALTPAMLEETRMPREWMAPSEGSLVGGRRGGMMGGGIYGTGHIPNNLQFGKGAVDPEALRIAAQGGKYDMDARRDAIAAQVAKNTAAEAAYNKSKAVDPWARYRGDGMLPVGFYNAPFDFNAAGG